MESALQLVEAGNYHDISMSKVARAAGLAKGTLYLYFETKEELFLAIFSEMFEVFFAELNHELNQMEHQTIEELANFTGSFISSRPLLMRFMTLSHTVLEQNTKAEAIIAFKQATLANTAKTGANLERLLPFIPQGQGAAVVLTVNALILGAQQLTHPSPNVKEILEMHPELRPFNLNTETFLTHLIKTHLQGLESKTL